MHIVLRVVFMVVFCGGWTVSNSVCVCVAKS